MPSSLFEDRNGPAVEFDRVCVSGLSLAKQCEIRERLGHAQRLVGWRLGPDVQRPFERLARRRVLVARQVEGTQRGERLRDVPVIGSERDLFVGQRPVEDRAGLVVLLLEEQYIAEIVERHAGFGVLRGQYLALDVQRDAV